MVLTVLVAVAVSTFVACLSILRVDTVIEYDLDLLSVQDPDKCKKPPAPGFIHHGKMWKVGITGSANHDDVSKRSVPWIFMGQVDLAKSVPTQ